mmetsp:Transcript_24804/g.32067  ORF Transcript_24804/g.32067 Transcript_24804/m.32067 type:complete len:590 (+) Transcript_24804:69-1838(+)
MPRTFSHHRHGGSRKQRKGTKTPEDQRIHNRTNSYSFDETHSPFSSARSFNDSPSTVDLRKSRSSTTPARRLTLDSAPAASLEKQQGFGGFLQNLLGKTPPRSERISSQNNILNGKVFAAGQTKVTKGGFEGNNTPDGAMGVPTEPNLFGEVSTSHENIKSSLTEAKAMENSELDSADNPFLQIDVTRESPSPAIGPNAVKEIQTQQFSKIEPNASRVSEDQDNPASEENQHQVANSCRKIQDKPGSESEINLRVPFEEIALSNSSKNTQGQSDESKLAEITVSQVEDGYTSSSSAEEDSHAEIPKRQGRLRKQSNNNLNSTDILSDSQPNNIDKEANHAVARILQVMRLQKGQVVEVSRRDLELLLRKMMREDSTPHLHSKSLASRQHSPASSLCSSDFANLKPTETPEKQSSSESPMLGFQPTSSSPLLKQKLGSPGRECHSQSTPVIQTQSGPPRHRLATNSREKTNRDRRRSFTGEVINPAQGMDIQELFEKRRLSVHDRKSSAKKLTMGASSTPVKGRRSPVKHAGLKNSPITNAENSPSQPHQQHKEESNGHNHTEENLLPATERPDLIRGRSGTKSISELFW